MGENNFKIFLGLELDKKAGTTLNQEIVKLTKNGINLKVGLDEDSLKQLTNAINGVTQQLQKMGSLGKSAGQGVANGFKEANKATADQLIRLREITQEYKNGTRTAEEYANKIKGMIFKKDGSLSAPAMKVPVAEMQEYITLLKQIENKPIQPIGKLVSTTDFETVKLGMTELVRRVETYSDGMGKVQTVTSLVGKETGELIASQQTLTTNQEKGVTAIEKQKASLEKLKNTVDKISSSNIDFINSGQTTSADNKMITQANEIKKEYQEIKALSEQGVVVEDSRIAKFKTLIAEQQSLIAIKEREIAKDKQLEQSLHNRDRITKQMKSLVSSNNDKFSTGVDQKESQEIEKLIEKYSKLNTSKNNMKIKTQELKDAVSAYVEKVKASATEQQKQQVATEKHTLAVQNLKNAYKNTNTKYSIGIDTGKSTAIKDQIDAFKQLSPLSDGYAQSLERIRQALAQYTIETRESANAVNTQFTNTAKLKQLQDIVTTTMSNAKGFYNQEQATNLNNSLETMRQMVASGQDVSSMLKVLGVDVSKFGKDATQAMQNSIKASNEQLKIYSYKEKMLVNLNLLEQKFASKNMDTAKIQALKTQLQSLTSGTQNLKQKVTELDVAYKKLSGEYQMKKIGTSMKSVLGMATGFYGLYSVFGYLRQGFSSIITETTKLDDAMIGLHRVTDESTLTYDKFRESALKTANAIGGSAKEIVDSTAEFAKLGYSFEESSQLAVNATKYATAGEVSLIEATDALSASYTVFGNTFDDVMGTMVDSTSIIDLYNKIGNTMAVTSGDIGIAMKASANSLSVANNSLSESVALIATANKTVQDSSKVGNALRTIAMRIRGVKEDTGELLPKMRELIKTATNGKVDVMDGDDFKSTYQVMLEISQVWDDLSDKQQAYLAEAVAGKNRAEVFTAIMGNAEDLTYAMEMAKDSIGSVDEEMAVVMQTFEKRVEVMKNSWASLASTTVSSDFVKGFVDGITAVLQYMDSIGGLIPVLTEVIGLFIILKGEMVATFAIGTVKSIGSILKAIVGLGAGVVRVGNAIYKARKYGASFTQAISAGGVALSRMTTATSLATAGIGLLVMAFGALQAKRASDKQKHEEYIEALSESTEKSKTELQSINDLKQRYEILYNTKDKNKKQNDELISVQNQLIKSLGLEEGALDSSKQSWDELSKAIDEASRKKMEYALLETNDLVKDAKDQLEGEMKNNAVGTKKKKRYMFETDMFLGVDPRREAQKIAQEVNEALGGEFAKLDDLGGIELFNIENEEHYLQVLRKIQEVTQNGDYEAYWDSTNYKRISEEIKNVEDLMTQVEEKTNQQYELKLALDMPNVLKDFDIKNVADMTKQEALELKKAFADMFSEDEKAKNSGYIEYFNKRVDATIRNKDSLQDLNVVSEETEDRVLSLSERVGMSVQKADILQVALEELDTIHDITGDTIDKLIKKYPELEEKLTDVDSAYQALNQKIAENNFSEASEGIADLVTVLEDLEAGNGITASSFKKISSGFPELLAYMNDEASLADAIAHKMEALKIAQKRAYDDMLMNSTEYYRVNVLNNDKMLTAMTNGINELFTNFSTAYDEDLKNWKSLADGKADIEEQLITAINKAWEGHFSVLMLKFNKMAGISIATPEFDREAYKQQLINDNPRWKLTQNTYQTESALEGLADLAERKFNSEIADWQKYQSQLADAKNKVAELFDIKFEDPNIQFSGSKSSPSSSSSSSSNPTTSYVASIYEAIVDEILHGGEEIEKAMDETNTKLDNAILMGNTALEEQLTAKLANLQVSLRDKQAEMAKELDAQIADMGEILSKSGAFKGYDITKLTQKDKAQVLQNIDHQINSATLAENDDEVKRLNDLKSLINDVGSVYLDTIEKRRDLSDRWWQEENNRMEKFAENLDKQYQKLFDEVDRDDKLLELRKSMLLEDGGEYDKEQKDADKILDINAQMLKNLLKKRTLCESQIAQLRAKGFKEESKEIQDLKDKWLDYEQARIDMIKEVAETRRQYAIESAQNELDDISESKDYIKDLLNLTIDMIKQETEAKKEALQKQVEARKEALKKEYEAEKKALEDKLSLLQKEADARKEALTEEKNEKEYQENVAEKQKEISNIQQKIDDLSQDDSITSQKLKKELQAQLDELIKELEKIQYDRSIELQQQAIDKELEMQEEKIEAELEKLEEQYEEEVEMIEDKYDAQLKEYEDYLKNQQKLKEDASKLIESRDKAFYERLKKYAMEYTDTTQAEFEDCWNKAYEALDKYGDKQLSVIEVIEKMTSRVIALNAELKKLNDSTYKDFIQDDPTTSSDDFEFAGDKNNSSSDKKVDEERDEIARKMNENSQKWFTASDEEKKRLAQENEKLAKEIGAWKATSDGDGWKKGEWVVSIGKKVYAVKNAVGVRHTGLETGEVGAPFGKFKLKSNEELNKLENGEIVLNGSQTRNIMDNVKKLQEGVQSSGLSIVVDMHDFNISKDNFEEFKKLMKVEVPKIINQRLINRGIK